MAKSALPVGRKHAGPCRDGLLPGASPAPHARGGARLEGVYHEDAVKASAQHGGPNCWRWPAGERTLWHAFAPDTHFVDGRAVIIGPFADTGFNPYPVEGWTWYTWHKRFPSAVG